MATYAAIYYSSLIPAALHLSYQSLWVPGPDRQWVCPELSEFLCVCVCETKWNEQNTGMMTASNTDVKTAHEILGSVWERNKTNVTGEVSKKVENMESASERVF